MRITSAWLNEHKACQDQVAIFSQEWPEGVTVSLEVLKRAAELSLSLGWFAAEVLEASACKAYNEEVIASAWKSYEEEAIASACKAYEEARAPALWKALKKQEA